MGFLGSLLGSDQAKAAGNAANDTYYKQQKAVRNLKDAGASYARDLNALSTRYDPYVQTGYQANDALSQLLSNPASVSSLPGYQFAQQEGVNALDSSAAAHGLLNSGRHEKDLLRFGTGLADQTYGSQLARLMGLNQQGIGATGAQVGTASQGLTGELGANQTAYQGEFASAPTIGQGLIAGANARGQGAANLFNTGLQALGFIGGGGMGGFGGFGGFGGGGMPFNPG
jgi:hypothetical protein